MGVNRNFMTGVILFMVIVVPQTFSVHTTTLQHGKHIKCISSIPSPTYTIPPIEEPEDESNLIFIDSGFDWKEYWANETFQNPVTDTRWQGFATIHTNLLVFTFVKSVQFSSYTSENFEIFLTDGSEKGKRFEVPETEKDQWVHYGVYLRNNNVYITKNNRIIHEIMNYYPNKITVRSKKATFWKMHKYSFKASKEITKEKPTIWRIPPSGKSNFILYTSLCEKCYLRIFTQSSKSETVISYSENVLPIAQTWEATVINIDPYNETLIEIYRERHDHQKFGHWAVDPRWSLVSEDNPAFYVKDFTSTSETTNFLCATLKDTDLENSQTDGNRQICLEPGKLGNNCSITCSEILGPNSKHCGRYRICENFNCSCSWGFHGSSCEKSCKSGNWGLNCQNSCESCDNCDYITGDCAIVEKGNAIIVGFSFIGVVVILVAAATTRLRRLRHKGNQQNDIFQDMTSQSNLL